MLPAPFGGASRGHDSQTTAGSESGLATTPPLPGARLALADACSDSGFGAVARPVSGRAGAGGERRKRQNETNKEVSKLIRELLIEIAFLVLEGFRVL
jgi:hypothetical protein